MISLDFLEKVEVFQDLDDRQLTAVKNCSREADFKRGDRLFGAGEKSPCLWVVLEGQVDLQEEPEEDSPPGKDALASLSEGLVFGWSSLVPPHEYRLSAYCTTRQCRVLKIDRQGLADQFERDPRMGYLVMTRLLSVIGSRFHLLQDQVIRRRGEEIMSRW